MSIISSITSTVSKAVTAVKTFAASKPLAFMNNVESNLQASPVKAAAVATGIIAAPAALSAVSTAVKAATPTVSTAIAAASPVVKTAAISTGTAAVKAIAAHPIKAAATVGAAIVGTNILATSSTARRTVAEAPSNLAVFGQNVGKAIDNPSLENIAKIGKDSPILTAAAVTAGAVIIGKAAGTAATMANTKVIEESNKLAKSPVTAPSGLGIVSSTSLPTPPTGDIQAEEKITIPKKKATPKKKAPKKRAKAKKKATKKRKTSRKKKLKFGSPAYRKKYLSKKYIKKKKSKKKKAKK